MQTRPRCFKCNQVIDNDPIFEAACGHDGCPSMVFHGICLMEWRERVQYAREQLRRWAEEHQEHDPGYGEPR